MLAEILSPRRVFLDLQPRPKSELLGEMTRRLDALGEITEHEDLARRLIEREEIITTAVKRGFALPHTFSESLPSLLLTVGIVAGGTDFRSLDGEPVQCILLLLGPPSRNHLRVLARLARIASHEEMLGAILETAAGGVPEALIELFLETDRRLAGAG